MVDDNKEEFWQIEWTIEAGSGTIYVPKDLSDEEINDYVLDTASQHVGVDWVKGEVE